MKNKSVMDCSVCTNTFGRDRRPHVLPCGHNFCLPCLSEICKKTTFLRCPDCRTEHRSTAVTDLPVNYGWESLVATLHLKEPSKPQKYDYPTSSKSEESIEGLCPDHESPRVSWCLACHTALCEDCIPHHMGDPHVITDLQQAMNQIKALYTSNNAVFKEWLAALESLSKGLLSETKTVMSVLEEIVPKIQSLQEKVEEQQESVEEATSVTELDKLVATAMSESKRFYQPDALDQVQEAVKASEKLETGVESLKIAASTNFSHPSTAPKDAWKLDYDFGPSAPPQDTNEIVTIGPPVYPELRIGLQHTTLSATVFGRPEVPETRMGYGEPMHLHRGQKARLPLPTYLSSPYTTRVTFTAPSTSSNFGIHYLGPRGMEPFYLEVNFKSRHVKMCFSDYDGPEATHIRPFPFMVQQCTTLDLINQSDQMELKVGGQMVGVQRKSNFDCVSIEVRGWDGVVILEELIVLEPSLPYSTPQVHLKPSPRNLVQLK
ncbi:uncharacterized protein LOC143025204 isoform X2 [Oratosquilla oratoria]|uniref:uncharacterized protein LOC143025204 isoform X2 n=1 Tax=Oratosquilla oratoria TaxID=337810 RepID=UPI003F75DCD5